MSGTLTIPKHAELPAAYRAAQQALAECTEIDECQRWADKAKALASYARQANDETLHRYADRIKARAIRRCGMLAKRIKPKQGARTDLRPTATRGSTANGAGVSARQLKTALRVASVPEDSFERQVESETPPTITVLAEQGKTPRQREFERMRGTATTAQYHAAGAVIGELESLSKTISKIDAIEAAQGVQPPERGRVLEMSARVTTWITAFRIALGEPP